MSALVLALALLSAGGGSLASAGGDSLAASEGPPFATIAASRTPGQPLRPAELVAARVRDVLSGDREGAAWEGLAEALPGMALEGTSDLEGTLGAASLAREIAEGDAAAPDRSAARVLRETDPAAPSMGRAERGLLYRIDGGLLGTLLSLAAVGGVLWWTVFRGTFRAPVRARGDAQQPVPIEPAQQGRWAEVRLLLSNGTPVPEVARRTGISREAVHVLMRMHTP